MGHTWLALMEVSYWVIVGSWSSINASKNNTVTAFNYYKDDVIIVEYEPDDLKVVFRKKGTE